MPNPTDLDSTIPNLAAPNSVTPLSNVTFPLSQPSTQNQHLMQTRSNSGITKPKLCYKAVVDYTYIKPPTYKLLLNIPNGVKQWMLNSKLYSSQTLGISSFTSQCEYCGLQVGLQT